MKKILSLILSVFVCLSLFFVASAYTDRYIIDYSGVLSSSEAGELEAIAEKLEDSSGIAVLFCVTDGTGEVTTDEFAQETYNTHTDNENGIIIVHDEWENVYSFFVSGNAGDVLSDAAVDSMRDAYDQNQSYFGGIYDCYALAEEYLENGYSDGYVSDEEPLGEDTQSVGTNEEKDGVSIIWLPVSLLGGLLVGFLIINGIASKNKSVKMQKNATVYTRPGSMVITASADNFLYNNVERREKPKQTQNQKN